MISAQNHPGIGALSRTIRRLPGQTRSAGLRLLTGLALAGIASMAAQAAAAPPTIGPDSFAAGKTNPSTPRKPPNIKPLQIKILQARYGGNFTSDACDVSGTIRKLCDNRLTCSIPVRDTLCETFGTVTPPLIPSLRVQYRCADSAHALSGVADKPFTLRISCSTVRR